MRTLAVAAAILLSSGCISKKKYDLLQADYSASRDTVAARDARIAALEGEAVTMKDAIASMEARVAELEAERGRLQAEKAELLKDKSSLKASVAEMTEALEELDRRKALAEQRIGQYKQLLSRFQSLIDAGKLEVTIKDGRMLVQLATDVLFPSGSAELSADGKAAIEEVSGILADLPTRRYQVEGHTDNVPIATAKYPSNWELASARALTVVRTMVAAGLAPERVSAAAYAEYDPVAPNDTTQNKALNRRIQIVVVPDLSDLPGFEELQAVAR